MPRNKLKLSTILLLLSLLLLALSTPTQSQQLCRESDDCPPSNFCQSRTRTCAPAKPLNATCGQGDSTDVEYECQPGLACSFNTLKCISQNEAVEEAKGLIAKYGPWIIAVIVVVIVLFLVCIGVCLCCCCGWCGVRKRSPAFLAKYTGGKPAQQQSYAQQQPYAAPQQAYPMNPSSYGNGNQAYPPQQNSNQPYYYSQQ